VFIAKIGVANEPSATRTRSRHSSLVDMTTIAPAAVSEVIPDLRLENDYLAKRQRLAEEQAQSPTFEPASTPRPTSLLNLSRQTFPPGASDGPILSPRAADRENVDDVSLVVPPSDRCDEENEQHAVRDAERHKTIDRDCSRKRKRGLSNTALRPPVDTTVPTMTQQQLRPSQPSQNSMPGRPRIGKALESCSPQSSSPGITASDGTDIDYKSGFDRSCQITDLTLCTIPHGSSIVTAIVRHHDSDWSLDPVALGHKCLGEQGKIIRMIQLSSGSWMLLGYRHNDGAVDICNRGGLNAELMSSPHSDTASHRSDHSEDNWNEVGEDKEEATKGHSHRERKLWLESDEMLLLSLRDKQGMKWEEVSKRFPRRTLGALKLRYWTLRKKGL